MSIPNLLPALIDELLLLFKQSLDYHRHTDTRAVLGEALAMLCRLRQKALWIGYPNRVAFVGLSNVGKSTLLNALLGEELAPRRNGPCTATAIEYEYADQYRIRIHNPRSFRQRSPMPCACAAQVLNLLQSLADDMLANGGQITVYAPSPLLAAGVILVDTPGFGAAQVEQPSETHEETLRRYLSTGVAQVFWVVLAEQGVTGREKAFYESFLVNLCDDIVVTGCEDWTTAEQTRFSKRFAEALSRRLPIFHYVSGLQGLRAAQAQDSHLLEGSGIPALAGRLCALADSSSRGQALQHDLEEIVHDLGCWFREFSHGSRARLSPWWRPDSWQRWLERTPANDLKHQLTLFLTEGRS